MRWVFAGFDLLLIWIFQDYGHSLVVDVFHVSCSSFLVSFYKSCLIRSVFNKLIP
jgi:hypothetical protein